MADLFPRTHYLISLIPDSVCHVSVVLEDYFEIIDLAPRVDDFCPLYVELSRGCVTSGELSFSRFGHVDLDGFSSSEIDIILSSIICGFVRVELRCIFPFYYIVKTVVYNSTEVILESRTSSFIFRKDVDYIRGLLYKNYFSGLSP